MKKHWLRWVAALSVGVCLQGCIILSGYMLLGAVRDVITVLNTVDRSMNTINEILAEGKEIKRVAPEGRFIATLCARIPCLVRERLEKKAQQQIDAFSKDLGGAALDLVTKSLAEDLQGARKAYNNMVCIYNEFSSFTNGLVEAGALSPAGS